MLTLSLLVLQKVNLALIANRRCAARVELDLKKQTLQQEAQLHQQWEDGLTCWRRSKEKEIVDQFRWVHQDEWHFCPSGINEVFH